MRTKLFLILGLSTLLFGCSSTIKLSEPINLDDMEKGEITFLSDSTDSWVDYYTLNYGDEVKSIKISENEHIDYSAKNKEVFIDDDGERLFVTDVDGVSYNKVKSIIDSYKEITSVNDIEKISATYVGSGVDIVSNEKTNKKGEVEVETEDVFQIYFYEEHSDKYFSVDVLEFDAINKAENLFNGEEKISVEKGMVESFYKPQTYINLNGFWLKYDIVTENKINENSQRLSDYLTEVSK